MLFSSPDLVNCTKHERVPDNAAIKWANHAMRAPGVIEEKGKYYFFFRANDIESNKDYRGIGVAVAEKPQGPCRDHLSKPLIDKFINGAQPIYQLFLR